MNISVPEATVANCDQFMEQLEGKPRNKTVIITPLRVLMQGPETYKMSFGCNFWKSCQNVDCSYCYAGMHKGEM